MRMKVIFVIANGGEDGRMIIMMIVGDIKDKVPFLQGIILNFDLCQSKS